jgi:hypothetical protein
VTRRAGGRLLAVLAALALTSGCSRGDGADVHSQCTVQGNHTEWDISVINHTAFRPTAKMMVDGAPFDKLYLSAAADAKAGTSQTFKPLAIPADEQREVVVTVGNRRYFRQMLPSVCPVPAQ